MDTNLALPSLCVGQAFTMIDVDRDGIINVEDLTQMWLTMGKCGTPAELLRFLTLGVIQFDVGSARALQVTRSRCLQLSMLWPTTVNVVALFATHCL